MTRIGSSRDSRDESVTAQQGSHVSKQTVEISERTLSVIAFGLSVAALVTSLWCMHDNEIQRRYSDREIDRLVHEVNKLNIFTQDHDALLMREGLKTPADAAKGPTGNLEYQPRR